MQARDGKRAELAALKARRFLASPKSATILLGDSHARRWPPDLPVPGHAEPVVNLGIGGDRVEDIHWRITKWPLGLGSPNSVVLFAGANNHIAGEEATLILRRFRALMETIRGQLGCLIVAVGLLPRGKNFWYKPECVVETNDGIADMSREFDFTAVFANASLARFAAEDALRLYYSDYAHLNEEGYKILASCFPGA